MTIQKLNSPTDDIHYNNRYHDPNPHPDNQMPYSNTHQPEAQYHTNTPNIQKTKSCCGSLNDADANMETGPAAYYKKYYAFK